MTTNTEKNQRNDVLYWRSKAIALGFENRMLIKHIRNIYKSTINYYNQSNLEQTGTIEDDEEPECVFEEADAGKTICQVTKPIKPNKKDPPIENFAKTKYKKIHKNNKEKDLEEDDDEFCKQPTQTSVIYRQGQAEGLYGKDWKKILGMETAVQLHYDLFIQKNKATFWPVVPMKIVFPDQNNSQNSDVKNE